MAAERYAQWLASAERRGIPAETVAEFARRHGIGPESFDVIDAMEELTDPVGQSYFVIPRGAAAADVQRAVLMTYILNAGAHYRDGDFPETPYSTDEVRRIADRQARNAWSYTRVVGLVQAGGTTLMTTPNGMLMGAGGNRLQNLFSQRGGTTWGDIFLFNSRSAEALRLAVARGSGIAEREGHLFTTSRSLARLLHHEEIHAQQWAREGFARFIRNYLLEAAREPFGSGSHNRYEIEAGLADGGYC